MAEVGGVGQVGAAVGARRQLPEERRFVAAATGRVERHRLRRQRRQFARGDGVGLVPVDRAERARAISRTTPASSAGPGTRGRNRPAPAVRRASCHRRIPRRPPCASSPRRWPSAPARSCRPGACRSCRGTRSRGNRSRGPCWRSGTSRPASQRCPAAPRTHGAPDRTATTRGSVARATFAPHAVVLASGARWLWHLAPVLARAYADAPTCATWWAIRPVAAHCLGRAGSGWRRAVHPAGAIACRKPARTTFLLACTTFSSASCAQPVASLHGAGATPTMAAALEIGHD